MLVRHRVSNSSRRPRCCGSDAAAAAASRHPLETCKERVMSVVLQQSGYDYAQKLIQNQRCVLDHRSDWTDHKPARSAENKFIVARGFAEFGKWHLGEDDEEAEGSKRGYKFPYGDFKNVHRCAVPAAETRAARYRHTAIELAAAHLHGMLDALMAGKPSGEKGHGSSVLRGADPGAPMAGGG